eukprot:Pgem_evm1s18953
MFLLFKCVYVELEQIHQEGNYFLAYTRKDPKLVKDHLLSIVTNAEKIADSKKLFYTQQRLFTAQTAIVTEAEKRTKTISELVDDKTMGTYYSKLRRKEKMSLDEAAEVLLSDHQKQTKGTKTYFETLLAENPKKVKSMFEPIEKENAYVRAQELAAREMEEHLDATNEMDNLAKQYLDKSKISEIEKTRADADGRFYLQKGSFFDALIEKDKDIALKVYQQSSKKTKKFIQEQATKKLEAANPASFVAVKTQSNMHFEILLKEHPKIASEIFVESWATVLTNNMYHLGGKFVPTIDLETIFALSLKAQNDINSFSRNLDMTVDYLPEAVVTNLGLKKVAAWETDHLRPVGEFLEIINVYSKDLAYSKNYMTGSTIRKQMYENLMNSMKKRDMGGVYAGFKEGLENSLELGRHKFRTVQAYSRFYKTIFLKLKEDNFLRFANDDLYSLNNYFGHPVLDPFQSKLILKGLPALAKTQNSFQRIMRKYSKTISHSMYKFKAYIKSSLPVKALAKLGDLVKQVITTLSESSFGQELVTRFTNFWKYITGKSEDFVRATFKVKKTQDLTLKNIDEMTFIQTFLHHAVEGTDLTILRQQKVLQDTKYPPTLAEGLENFRADVTEETRAMVQRWADEIKTENEALRNTIKEYSELTVAESTTRIINNMLTRLGEAADTAFYGSTKKNTHLYDNFE